MGGSVLMSTRAAGRSRTIKITAALSKLQPVRLAPFSGDD